MTKLEQVSREAAALSDEQLAATLEFIRSLKEDPFFCSAPPEAIASIERGRQQTARGERLDIGEVSRRLEQVVKREKR